jgi:PAS domain S-box-containing protein
MYDPSPYKDLTVLYSVAASMLGFALLVIAVRLMKTSRSLKQSEAQIRRQYQEISQINETLEHKIDARTIELKQSRDQWIRTFDAIPDMIIVTDTECRITQTNRAARETLAALSGEIIGCHCHSAVHGLDTPPDYCPHRLFVADGEPHEKELFEPRLNRHCTVTVSPMYEGTKSTGCIMVVRDITERKRLEAIRDEAQNRLLKIASRVPGVIYQYKLRSDGSSCFPYASDAIREIYRVSAEEVREDASKVFNVLHPDDIYGVIASITLSAQNLTIWCHEYRVCFDDGTVRWLLGNAMPESKPDGGVLWHGFISDITERKLTEEAVLKNEERLRLILKGLNDAPWDWNLENNDCYYSPNWWEMIGYTADELPSDSHLWQHFMHPDDVEVISRFFSDVLLHGPDAYQCEFRLQHKDGYYVPVKSRGFILRDSHGTAVRASGANSDLTQQKRNEAELLQARKAAEDANRAKSRFLAVVAHEFRSPLSVLSMSVDILDRYGECLSREEQQEQQEQIRNASEQMASLVDSVLVFSRLEKPGISLEPALLDVAEACRTIIAEIVPLSGGEHVFTLTIAPECGRKLLVEILFHRVIANLLSNAIRFTPPGGTIALSVNQAEQLLVIEVSDTGIGIPEDEQQKIFEAFYRSSNVDARNGLGLGLSIVDEAITLMNGSVSVTSRVGVGSIFRVTLPCE